MKSLVQARLKMPTRLHIIFLVGIFINISIGSSSKIAEDLFSDTNVKIQLDESFEFIGSENYDADFDTTGLSVIFKDIIYNRLKQYYGDEIIANRLFDNIGADLSDQEYVYVRGNISRIKRIQFISGGNIDLRTAKEQERDNSISTKKYGAMENIFFITGGFDFFDLGTGEVFFNIVYTIATKRKVAIDQTISKEEVYAIYNNSSKELFQYLLDNASKKYIPGIKFANIVENYEDETWIINKGFSSGFDVGKFVIPMDNKKNKFRIIESSPQYSLIAPFPKRDINLHPGETMKLFGNQLSKSSMPKILVMPVEFCYSELFDKNIDYDKSTITQWFKDHLNSIAKLDIVPSQGSLFKSQSDAAYYSTVSTEDLIGNLTRPDYIAFPKITYAFQQIYEGEESLGFKTSLATLKVGFNIDFIDLESGILLHSETHEESKEEKLAENLAYVNIIDLFPSMVKDGIYRLSEKIAKNFNTEYVEGSLNIKKEDVYFVDYASNAIYRGGQILPFYRAVKEYKNADGEKNGALEIKQGMIRIVNDDSGKTVAIPLGSLKPRDGDIIRGYSAPKKISKNLVSLREIKTTSKIESQLPIEAITIKNNLTSNISKSYNLSIIADENKILQIDEIKNYLNSGFYSISGESNINQVKPNGYLDISSIVINKNIIHDTRIDIQYAIIIKLYNLDNSEIIKEVQAQEIIIGDNSSSKRKKKKRKKKNQILKGLSSKDIEYKFVELNNAYIKEILNRPSFNTLHFNAH